MKKLKILLFLFCFHGCYLISFSQEKYCKPSGKNVPENDCEPCSLDTKYSIVVQTIIRINELEKMEMEIKRMTDLSANYYKTHGNLKMRYVNDLDLDIKSVIDAAGNNPQKLMDAYRELEYVMKKEGCYPSTKFDGRTDGVADGGLQDIQNTASISLAKLKLPNYMGPMQFSFDCCNKKDLPNDFIIQQSEDINTEIDKYTKYFENFKLLHEINLKALQFAAISYQQYDDKSKKDLERLRNNSFSNVLGDALVGSQVLNKDQLNKINDLLKKYKDANDKAGLQNAIRQAAGDDAAEIYGVLLEDITPADLLNGFGEYLKNNPGKLKTLEKLNKLIPGKPEWFGKFMNLVQIAEMSVNILFDTFLKLGGDAPVREARERWWCLAQWNYYCALQSILANAATLQKLKQTLHQYNSFFPKPLIPVGGTAIQTPSEVSKLLNSKYGLNVTAVKNSSNQYTVQMPAQQQVIFVIGEYYCGKWVEKPKAEITPEPKKRKIFFQFGCGASWSNQWANREYIDSLQLPGKFVDVLKTSNQAMVVDSFSNSEIRNKLGYRFDFNFGYRLNDKIHISTGLQIGGFDTKLKGDYRIVQLVTNPTPATKQSRVGIEGQTRTSFLNVSLGAGYSINNNWNPFAEAGGLWGFYQITAVQYQTSGTNFQTSGNYKAPNYGAYVRCGINKAMSDQLSFHSSANLNIIPNQGNCILSPAVMIGLRVAF